MAWGMYSTDGKVWHLLIPVLGLDVVSHVLGLNPFGYIEVSVYMYAVTGISAIRVFSPDKSAIVGSRTYHGDRGRGRDRVREDPPRDQCSPS